MRRFTECFLPALLFPLLAHATELPLPARLHDPFHTERKAQKLIDPSLNPSACPGEAGLPAKLDFQQVVVLALCHNPDTRSAYYGLLAQAASYGSNYSSYLPNASYSASTSRSASYSRFGISSSIGQSSGFSAGMLLFDFGRREATLDSAEQSLIATGHNFDSTLQATIAQALRAYYQLLTSQNALLSAQESERYARESYEAADLRHSIGQVPLADVLQSRGAYSQARLATETAENQFYQAQSGLAILMGLSPKQTPQVEELDDSALTVDPFGGKVDALIEKAKSSRYDLAASRAQVEGARASLKATQRADLPSISASASSSGDQYYYFRRSSSRSQSVGLSVSIPIFTGFSQTYNERAARNSLAQQQEQLAKSELSVEQDVWNAWHNYITARQTWETSFDLLSSASQLKDVALGRYKEGLGTILDVLNAQSQYSSALQSQLQSRYNLLTTRLDLVRAVGVLNLDTMRPDAKLGNPEAASNPKDITDENH